MTETSAARELSPNAAAGLWLTGGGALFTAVAWTTPWVATKTTALVDGTVPGTSIFQVVDVRMRLFGLPTVPMVLMVVGTVAAFVLVGLTVGGAGAARWRLAASSIALLGAMAAYTIALPGAVHGAASPDLAVFWQVLALLFLFSAVLAAAWHDMPRIPVVANQEASVG